jgi:hypothetical protein
MPERLGSREQARELLASLPKELGGVEIIVDFESARSTRPSFVDEVVKIVLVERRANRLVLSQAPPTTCAFAERSALSRSVIDRLECRRKS